MSGTGAVPTGSSPSAVATTPASFGSTEATPRSGLIPPLCVESCPTCDSSADDARSLHGVVKRKAAGRRHLVLACPGCGDALLDHLIRRERVNAARRRVVPCTGLRCDTLDFVTCRRRLVAFFPLRVSRDIARPTFRGSARRADPDDRRSTNASR